MDLHIVGAEPTDEERAAVDAVLGEPDSGWRGGVRDAARDGRGLTGGREVWAERHRLLPALHAVQDRVGWISRGALNHICRRLDVPPAEAWGVLTFYHLLSPEPRPPIVAHVCDDIACRLQGAERLCRDLEAALGPPIEAGSKHGRDGESDRAGNGRPAGLASNPPASAASAIAWMRSPCLGQCDRAPAALVIRAGTRPSREEHPGISDAASLARICRSSAGGPAPTVDEPIPQAGSPGLKLLRRVGVVDPGSLADYRAHGGYRALSRALEIGPQQVIAEVTASGLLGRGGAAFPTGRKWAAVAREPVSPHYVVCNADESEPGTFKDRVLLARDPFAIVEALTICGYAVGAERGFIYIRGEYPVAEARLARAIGAAREAGLLGGNVAGAGFRFDLEIRRGAGAYICGEETALFNSLEGKRGEPRSKPPFPAQAGLFGKPTVVNNVETLANVLDILLEGGAQWATIGTKGSTGTRLFCVSGHVVRPGLYEVPFGRTLGALIAEAGGVPGGRGIKGVLLGGAAGVFVGPERLDMPLTFEDARAAGATLGSGVVMVFDETSDLPDTLARIARFFEDESCGQCVPCRVGTVRQRELLERLASHAAAAPEGTRANATLGELDQAMRDASICGLGQTAASAIESAVRLHLIRPGDRP